ncbi:MAG TPA: LuxR C-terminal-related transcriptional regulator [Nocardioidaceae bacterium]|nr:LuxR C-terminal-related transcriptional regulator [Nocardioidaceae bacterium]
MVADRGPGASDLIVSTPRGDRVDQRLERGRRCYEQRVWREAHDLLAACDATSPLQEADLERLAIASFLSGEDEASDDAWRRAHQRHVDLGDRSGAVRCAFWLAFRLLNAGDLSSADGWIARTERLLCDAPEDSPEQGSLAYLTGLLAVFSADLVRAEADLGRSAQIAERCDDPDLSTLARLALGRVLIFRGDVPAGVRLLDEAMVAVLAGETSPVVAGDSFCTAIDACHDVFDVRRGQAWTEAFSRWCETQPDLVPFAGLCLVHRAEFLQLKGAWVEAMAQAGLARRRLSLPVVQPSLGAAIYEQGELMRLRGRFGDAERHYREASSRGRDPQPGLALLRLAQGQDDVAVHGIERALAEAEDRGSRAPLLAACVEIMLAHRDVPAARAAGEELVETARALGSPLLAAMADRATGAVMLADTGARAALARLRRASDGFRSLGASYELARTGILVARARRALGDEEGARLELEASRATLEDLGATADLATLDATGRGTAGDRLLTARELQVLRLVARGLTNRSIGVELGLSERTIDRHVSNIFTKLGVSSRAAATALAYESDLL